MVVAVVVLLFLSFSLWVQVNQVLPRESEDGRARHWDQSF